MNVNIDYTIEQIATICKGKWVNKNKRYSRLAYLSLDSRKINFPGTTLFFAIKNNHRNANSFLIALYKKGVRNFVTDDQKIDQKSIPSANIIRVQNSVMALQNLATYHREKFPNLPVIGIAGSNGKTIVKEWLNQLLEKEFSIIRSPKSYNSQIGVPLSVLNISAKNNLAIFEAGISLPREMENIEKIIQPNIGIFTNIGNAHDEGFESRKQKIREKLLLFQNASHLIFSTDYPDINREIKWFQKKNNTIELFTWGKNNTNILQVLPVIKNKNQTLIKAIYKSKTVSITIPFTDDASIENAINCWCVLFIINKAGKAETMGFSQLYAVAMRLELKPGINGCNIINDSYSNDLHSLNIALDFLDQQKNNSGRTIILSDILQSGLKPNTLYLQVAGLLKQKKIDHFIGIGPGIFQNQKVFSFFKSSRFFRSTRDFLQQIHLLQFNDETILIKGARQFEFEKISRALELKIHQTVLSINLSALVFNLKKYKEKILPSTKIMAMVKAFGYGSGSHEVAAVLEYNKIDYLAVAYVDEGIELRKSGITIPIMIMNIDNSTFDSLITYHLEPEIFSLRLLNDFINYLKLNQIENYPVHLKIDTGMHRLGFMENEIGQLCKKLSHQKNLKIKSVFSHLSSSDDPRYDEYTLQQSNTFKNCFLKIENTLGYSFDKHISNTAAISRLPRLQYNMVRLGIGLYGIDADKKMQKQLKNVSTLTTTISQIKKIKEGETVGYGRNAKVKRPSTIATVRIGYADGYSRLLGNGVGKMMIQNKMVPVIGNVCMDMVMLDITGLKNIKEGDEVTVFGELLPVDDLAKWAKTISYEIMTSISQRVKRVYFEE